MRRLPLALLIASVALTGALALGSGDREPAALEVEIERGEQISWLRVYIRNDLDQPLRFQTGTAGGAHHNRDDGTRPGEGIEPQLHVGGTASTVLPELMFAYGPPDGGAKISIRPPALSGLPRRSMRPEVFEVPAHGRELYCRFAVPSVHVSGDFAGAIMRIPRNDEVGPGDSKGWRYLVGQTLIEGTKRGGAKGRPHEGSP